VPVTIPRRLRNVRWLGTGVWIGSWYLMYLEITRWHHVKPSLAFNPGPPSVTGVRPRPGRPLKILYAACIAAPLTVAVTLIFDGRRVLGPAGYSRPERP
jgi:hypothetical protein